MRVIKTKTKDGIVTYHPMSRAQKIMEMCDRLSSVDQFTQERKYSTTYEQAELTDEEAAEHGLVDPKAVSKAKDNEIEKLKAELAAIKAKELPNDEAEKPTKKVK
jgi:hypothetical protein